MARLQARYSMTLDELDVTRDAASLDVPLLVVHDRDDRVVAFEEGERLASAAPHGELAPTTGLGHRAILRAPDVVERITGFLGAVAPQPSFAETLDGELFMPHTRWRTG
jgi:pimeloyl-ACP methyl ester carboxylesterase